MNFDRKMKLASMALLFLLTLPVPALVQAATFGHTGKASQVGRTIRITALDIRFDKIRLHVRAGETIRFIVTNKGQLTHEFIIGDAREQAEHEQEMKKKAGMGMPDEPNGITLKPGQTKTLIWTFGLEGEVEFACHVPGHYAAGMVGKIFVGANTK
ncbi:MAG: Cupredoxin domain protein [Candidatus Gallionella acididurans]|uniref:Cupredoxin domain protein n=1 Tax=Candidatus Gallionella acididurans TaxID=1796491 RepID=A0A139BN63_9PROT|nr:MAG: Cupredoxin domain protein [Candidatus Gallionella acididurans]